jgi:Uma2 family endonuclease
MPLGTVEAMSVLPARYRFNLHEYHLMTRGGVFDEDDRVELIDGEVIDMAPIGSRHAACVKRLAHLLTTGVGEEAIVSVQDPIELSVRSEPQPDVALLRPRPDYYAAGHPLPPDVLLIVEVSDTTAQFDRLTKVPLYVEARIREVWLVDLPGGVLEVFGGAGARSLKSGDTVAPHAFPDVVLEVAAILGDALV